MENTNKIRRKDSRPGEIVSCAVKLFIEKGYFETNFVDIAKAGNMARSTIYLYFKDKKSILKAALKRQFEENKSTILDSDLDRGDGFHERMVKLLSRMQKITCDHFFKRFLIMVTEVATKDPEIAQIWKEEIFDNLHAIWRSLSDEFKLDKHYRDYLFSVLYSVFLTSCLASVCFGKQSPFIQFDEFVAITSLDIQQGKFDGLLDHE